MRFWIDAVSSNAPFATAGIVNAVPHFYEHKQKVPDTLNNPKDESLSHIPASASRNGTVIIENYSAITTCLENAFQPHGERAKHTFASLRVNFTNFDRIA